MKKCTALRKDMLFIQNVASLLTYTPAWQEMHHQQIFFILLLQCYKKVLFYSNIAGLVFNRDAQKVV